MVQFKLIDIVKQFMSEIGLPTTHGVERYLQFGIDAIREMNMDVSGAPTWTVLEIDHNTQRATLPSNCIRILTIGELTNKNNVRSLITDRNMVLSSGSSEPFRSHIFGEGHSYGNTAISGASYRNDYKMGQLKVSSGIASDCLYLEYLADVEHLDGKYMVLPYDKQAVISYIRWANVRSNLEVPQNARKEFKNQWLDDKGIAGLRTNAMTLDEWLETHYKGLTGTLIM